MTTHQLDASAVAGQTTLRALVRVRGCALLAWAFVLLAPAIPRVASAAPLALGATPQLQEGDPGQDGLSGAAAARGTLTFEDRVACREKVEDVYWAHRIWPTENPEPKPSRDTVLPREAIAASVERALRYDAALATEFGEPLTPAAIQAEMARQGRASRDPALLREIWEALDNDPLLVAECLVRPELAERQIRARYATDSRLHAAVRAKAERAIASARSFAGLRAAQVGVVESTWIRRTADDATEPAAPGTLAVSPAQWESLTSGLRRPADGPLRAVRVNALGSLREDDDRFYVQALVERAPNRWRVATASWPKIAFAAWWRDWQAGHPSPIPTPAAASYHVTPLAGSSCVNDTWRTIGSESGSGQHIVWTGTEMLTMDYNRIGRRYSPATDRWSVMTSVGAPDPSGAATVWTGSEWIFWGGNGGARYSPTADRWLALPALGAPSPRGGHTAIWTGSEMIVWGGAGAIDANGLTGYLNTGARYSPASNVWTPTSTVNAAGGRARHSAVWTGTQMIVWGGDASDLLIYPDQTNTGGLYFPATNTWAPTPTAGAPLPRAAHRAVWTGLEMIVYGGEHLALVFPPPFFDIPYTDGARYRPGTNTWTPLPASPGTTSTISAAWTGSDMFVSERGSPRGLRYRAATDQWTQTSPVPGNADFSGPLLWTGSELIVWGQGLRYDPTADTYRSIPRGGGEPLAPALQSSVWTGTEMILWGGQSSNGQAVEGGARYLPATDTWLQLYRYGVGNVGHTAVWTGSEMIVWGGTFRGADQNAGGRYSPMTDSWTATSTSTYPPERRHGHTAVWTGSEMIVWGGTDGTTSFKTGGRYDPVSDLWSGISAGTNCPVGRSGHTAVWTGSQMVVWGGRASAPLASGGRYDPATDLWTATSLGANAPTARWQHTSIWTGSEMIVWGGSDGAAFSLASGGRYLPASNTWLALGGDRALSPALRSHVAVWTGRDMVVWGGYDGRTFTSRGGRYTPSTSTWAATTSTNAPLPRAEASAAWTGSEMIVWGGASNFGDLHSGGRYCVAPAKGLAVGLESAAAESE